MKKLAIGILLCVFLAAPLVRAQQPQPQTPPPAPSDQNNRQGAIIQNVNLVDVLFSVVTKR